MPTKFSLLFNDIKTLRSRYLSILGAFYIYDHLLTLSAPNKVGKKSAIENVSLMNCYKYFFSVSKETCRCYFFVEIAKFFDKDKRTISLINILDFAEANILDLTKNDFLKFHNNRTFINELFNDYKELKLSDISKLRRDIKSKESIILKFKGYRDQYLAHDDAIKNKYAINISEIRQISSLISRFLKLFYLKLDFSSNSYVNYIKEPKREIDELMKCLYDYGKKQQEDIKNKHKL